MFTVKVVQGPQKLHVPFAEVSINQRRYKCSQQGFLKADYPPGIYTITAENGGGKRNTITRDILEDETVEINLEEHG